MTRTYRIEVLDGGRWEPAPGESSGWSLAEAIEAVRRGIHWLDGTRVMTGDIRIVEDTAPPEPDGIPHQLAPAETESATVQAPPEEVRQGMKGRIRRNGYHYPAEVRVIKRGRKYTTVMVRYSILDGTTRTAWVRVSWADGDPVNGVFQPLSAITSDRERAMATRHMPAPDVAQHRQEREDQLWRAR